MWLRVLQLRWQSWVAMIATVVIAWTSTTTNHAAIIVHSNGGVSAGADARANRTPLENGRPVIGGEADLDNDSGSDLGTVTTVTVGAAASVSGASATSGSSVSATVTADTAADTLEIVAAGSTSLFAASNAPTSSSLFSSIAAGNTFFAQGFDLTERSYEYTLSADTEVSVTQGINDSMANAFIRLDSGFDRLIERRIHEDGFLFSMGSLSGVLAPGNYAFSGHTGGVYQNGQADATFALLFELTAASRWIDPAGGTFRVADNWEAPIVPGASDVAVFDLPGTYMVQLDQDVTNKRLRANGAGVNVSFDLNGNDYVLDEISIGGLDGDSVSITFADTSGPIVSAASAAADDGIAQAAGGVAERRLRARLLKAGKGGTANVNIPIMTTAGLIDGGGSVRVRDDGRWTVDTLEVGQGGLIVQTGGGISATGVTTLAPDATDNTLATVSTNGSFLESHELIVGKKGNGTLSLANRGTVFADVIVVGDDAGSLGDVQLTSGAAIVQETVDGMAVGLNGRGRLSMSDSTVDAGYLFIGSNPGSDGEVKVGSNSTLKVTSNTSPLLVGGSGHGKLIVEGGGRVIRENFGKTNVGALGEIEVRSGHFHENLELNLDALLTLTSPTGSASIGRNLILRPGYLTVGPGGTLSGEGFVVGGIQELPGGRVLPANSPGTLTVDGDFEQTGGLLGIEIAGTAPGQFDVLAVTGNAILGGELLLEFIDGFAPRQGDEFAFLDVGGALSGAFDNVGIRNLAPGFQFDLRADAGGLTMVALNDGVFLVPEPATLEMLFTVVLAMCFRRRDSVINSSTRDNGQQPTVF